MRRFILKLAAVLTRTNRAVPEFEWSNLWTCNLFRTWEWLFGKPADFVTIYRKGFRPKKGWVFHIKIEGEVWTKDGKVFYKSYTVENYLARIEVFVRNVLGFRTFLGEKTERYPNIAYQFGAIALDTFDAAANSGSTGTTQTVAYTVTGSNAFLSVGCLGEVNSNNISQLQYAGNATVMAQNKQTPNAGRWTYLFSQGSVTNGNNNLVVTKTNNTYSEIHAQSYSGCQSSNTPDSSNSGSAAAISVTVSTTVVATNSWLAGYGSAQTSSSISTNRTDRFNSANQDGFDSNGTVGTGSQSTTLTINASDNLAFNVLSFAPAVVNVSRHLLTVMGAGS